MPLELVLKYEGQRSRSHGRVEGEEHGLADVETIGLDGSSVRVFDCAGQVNTVIVSIFYLFTGARERRHFNPVSKYTPELFPFGTVRRAQAGGIVQFFP